LSAISKLNTKNATVHSVGKFASKITKLQDRQQLNNQATETSETASDTKTVTQASTVDQKSMIGAQELSSEARYDELFVPQIKNEFASLELESLKDFREQPMHTLLAPDAFSCIELPNEQSYQEKPHGCSLLFSGVNQESYNSIAEETSDFADEDVDAIHLKQHDKKFQMDDYGLQVASRQRNCFAQKHLFGTVRQDLFIDEESSYEDEQSDYEGTFHEASFPTPSGEISSPSCGQSAPLNSIENTIEDQSL
jgi:hypothetical protein